MNWPKAKTRGANKVGGKVAWARGRPGLAAQARKAGTPPVGAGTHKSRDRVWAAPRRFIRNRVWAGTHKKEVCPAGARFYAASRRQKEPL